MQYAAVAPARAEEEPRRKGISSFLVLLAGAAVLAVLYAWTSDHTNQANKPRDQQLLALHTTLADKQASIKDQAMPMLANSTASEATTTGASPLSPLAEISTGKEVRKSIAEAFDESTAANSHYVKGYNDKSVHLMVILVLIIVPAVMYYTWKTQEKINARGGNAVIDTENVKAKASAAATEIKSRASQAIHSVSKK